MIIVTPEFKKTVEDLIKNLQPENFPDATEYKLIRKHNALPFGLDLDTYVFLTPSGEIIWDDNNGEVGSVRNLQSLIRLLVAGEKRYPQLEKFIPNRSIDSKTCPVCEGSGIWTQSLTEKPGKCFFCAGLGWVTEEFWNEFTASQKNL